MTAFTREEYIHAVRDKTLALAQLEPASRERLQALKLVYGSGYGTGARGVTYFGAWSNGKGPDHPEELIEVCAFGEESLVQLAGTTIHELGHALAGPVGHSVAWKGACERLGLRAIRAAGTTYRAAMFAPQLREQLAALPVPTDGKVTGWHNGAGAGPVARVRPCSQGVGTRGGKSRGPGSGSRLRKFVCGCGVIVRASRDELSAHCDLCSGPFNRG